MSQTWNNNISSDLVDISKVQADLDSLRSSFSAAAVTPSVAVVGQYYYNTSTSRMNICTNATGPVFAEFHLTTLPLDADMAFNAGLLRMGAFTGDITKAAGSLATTIGTAVVSYAKIQNIGALSVLGRSANTSGVGADITGTDGQVLRVAGTVLGFGTIVAAGIASDAVTTVKILDANVTLAKIVSFSATQRLWGRNTAGSGVAEEVTASQLLDWRTSTRGAILYRGVSTWDGLAPGTVGLPLVSAGSGADPSYTALINTGVGTALITGMTDDTAPDMAADYLMTYDASATALKKSLLKRIGMGKQGIWIPAGAFKSRGSNGCAVLATVETTTNKINLETLDYDAAAVENAQVPFRAPASWGTTTLTAIFVWKHAATATNFGVVWGLRAVALSDNEAGDTAMGTGQEVTDTGGTTNNIYISPETAAITVGSTFAAGDLLYLEVYRNATSGSDTMTIDAGLLGVMVYVTTVANTDT